MTAASIAADVQARARLTVGRSHDAIHLTVAALFARRKAAGVLADIGCGHGDIWRIVRHQFSRHVGVDAVRYHGLPAETMFHAVDFDGGILPLDDASADATAAVEVIEHVENPRAFCRELVRITKPGGWVVVTTPNQISALSMLTLVVKRRFAAFQDSAYPAHRTALLPIDLQRIASECGLCEVSIHYTLWGRMPLTPWHYPRFVSVRWPGGLSDNVVMIGRR